jgi:hypothetical protein
MPESGDMRHLAVSKSRFALHAANYTPDTHLIGFYELPLGSKTMIGRETTSYPSYLLGLSDEIRPGPHNDANQTLSRNHFTIEVSDQGNIRLEDQSKNGTTIISR